MKASRSIPMAWAMALWATLALAIALLGARMGYGGKPFAVAVLVLALLLAGQIFNAARGFRKKLKGPLGEARLLLLPLGLGFAYAGYLAGTGNLTWPRLVGGLAYVEVPALLGLWGRGRAAGAWQDYAALVVLWAPIEFAWGRALFPYPAAATHTLEILLGLNAGIVDFLYLRELDGVGYTIAWGRGFASAVILNFVIFAAIAIPLGEWMHFIRWAPSMAKLKSLPLTALGVLFFTAWPEEFLFRGLLQNLLSKSFRNETAGWLVASGLFGLSHIVHGFPNWKYVLLATIAGLFYGMAWAKTKSMTSSCLVHALVDTIWHTLF
ncbi:MAG TPA: CPBP family intramembrane glutamic endopeptidase [Candidatus Dormibacteraeota bacterium]|nr:CPBP family intramembrane glutamic endopeptidase [Candidatus Dormibacteraeota bacterium]